jgi:iron-sulfur cluster repair protein YtfE (RIC family)
MTDALLGEHGVLYAIFDYLEPLVAGTDDADELKQAVALLNRVLVSHAELENELLFPVLEKSLGPAGPLAVMRGEHEEIDGTLSSLASVDDPARLKQGLASVFSTARAHFAKEEQVLFPLAEQHLGEAALVDLGSRWGAGRGVSLR